MGIIMYRNNRYAGGGSADPSLHFDWSNQTLPQTGDTNTIYCIPTGDTSDPWDFYAWNDTDEEFVKIDFSMTISIDSALSDTSTNPVQNKVVKGAIDAKADNTQTFTEAGTRANIASGETFAVILGKIKKFFTDLKAVAFSGSYNDLSDKPTIPAAQVNSDWNQTTTTAKDYIKNKPTIPAAQVNSDWNASSGVAQILNKPSSMPASDVYAWAKAATKPSYTASEVGALASNGTAAKATADANGNTISSTYMKKGVDRVTAGKSSYETIGTASTADGYAVTASGDYSHASGYHTKALSDMQHVIGKYNEEDANGTYAFIVGGGRLDFDRKNIFTIDWNGDVNAGRSNGLTNDTKLPTGADVISYLNSNLVEGDITVSSGFTLEHKKVKKYMRVVSVEYKGSITPSSTGWFTIGNIANSAMRPVNQFDVFAVDNNSSTSALGCQVRITTDGDIKVYSFTANKALRPIILATYIV